MISSRIDIALAVKINKNLVIFHQVFASLHLLLRLKMKKKKFKIKVNVIIFSPLLVKSLNCPLLAKIQTLQGKTDYLNFLHTHSID